MDPVWRSDCGRIVITEEEGGSVLDHKYSVWGIKDGARHLIDSGNELGDLREYYLRVIAGWQRGAGVARRPRHVGVAAQPKS